ncbi:MAG: hypothetical protein ABEN55_05960 [Bradymonadaceae bacterium]
MVDTERFQLGPQLIHTVTTVAAQVAVRQGETASPLQVATYVPLDVDSVGRILEAVEEDYDLERIERDGICYFSFKDPDAILDEPIDIDAGEHLAHLPDLENNLAALKSDEGWSRKVREQHDILQIAAGSDSRTVELPYFLSRTDVPSARVQSILNDFDAENYVEHDLDEEDDVLEYAFPELDYPEARHARNMEILAELDGSDRVYRIWLVLGAFALVLLIVVIVLRFYA